MIVLKALFVVAFLGYPVLVYFGLLHFEARFVALILVLAVAVRLAFTAGRGAAARRSPPLLASLGVAAVIGFLALVSNVKEFLKFYPVAMSVTMFVLFFASVLRPPTIVERIARMRTPELPDTAIAYTRRVTLVWCGFFVLNAAISLYTCLGASLETWTLYNGLISYILMGTLFVGELLVRRRVQRTHRTSSGAKSAPDPGVPSS